MGNLDPSVLAAIVAAATSLFIFLLTQIYQPFWEKYFHKYKLEQEYIYEQRKNIKNTLARNKIQLINSCESLDHRIWNLAVNYQQGWQNNERGYYCISFVYRFLSVCAWIKKTNDEMLYLDSTIATKKDLEFIKFLRLFPQILCDVELFHGFEYDANEQKDHFFSNNLDLYTQTIMNNNSVYTFTEYLNHFDELHPKIEETCKYFKGISPDEDRLRWDRLQLLGITIMAFLNSFGYDFQKSPEDKFKEIINKPRENKLITNYKTLITKNGMSKQKYLKRTLKAINNPTKHKT
jgi:hypothetical protein